MKGKTITTFLIDGTPKGIKTVFISNKVCKAVVIPRAKLNEVKIRNELSQPALYFLVSESEEKIYVGETENFLNRVIDHDNKKDFWELAIIFVSKDNDLTKSDIKYLEYLALKEIKEIAKFNLEENKNSPQIPNLPEHQKASIEEFFDDIKFLTSFLGFSIFDKIEEKNKNIFFCNGRDADAKGIYDENGFTILKGSKISSKSTNSYNNKEKREAIIKNSCKKLDTDFYILEKNLTFKSPSSASSFCVGSSTNGWIAWKNKDDKTLDEIFRRIIK